MELALFPLSAVLFSGCRIPLQIFEQRYLDLVKQHLLSQRPFGLVTLKGDPAQQVAQRIEDEVPDVPELLPHGTLANIVDFNHQANGLLGIVIEGGEQFRVQRCWYADDLLVEAEVEPLPAEEVVPVPDEQDDLLPILLSLQDHPFIERLGYRLPDDAEYWMQDTGRLANHLAALFPLPLREQYALLELRDPIQRLSVVQALLSQLSGEASV